MTMHYLTIYFLITCYVSSLVLAEDGKWSEWTSWTTCSVTCGEGNKRRYRDCNSPPPKNGGKWCAGSFRDTRKCEGPLACPVNGGWSDWSKWTGCSVTCGQGQRRRRRDCDNPVPLFGGDNCEGKSTDYESCTILGECPRDGGWSLWGKWSHCSVSCGVGVKHRIRECNNPVPAADGQDCTGKSSVTKECDSEINCPVNGQWSEWGLWTPCSVTCGEGQKQRVRSCDNPAAQNGGKPCSIVPKGHIEVQQCTGTIKYCAVNGGWSEWGEWGPCETAGCKQDPTMSFAFNKRSCNSPVPRNGGSMCSGTFLNGGICSQPTNCKRNGGWSEWSDWVCTEEEARRTRTCTNPPPSHGGLPCPPDPTTQFYIRIDNRESYNLVCEVEEDYDRQPIYENDEYRDKEEDLGDDWSKK